MAALQEQVVGDQLLPVGVEHRSDPPQQGFHFRPRLQRQTSRPGDALGRGAGGHHILGLQHLPAAFAQPLQQPLLLLFAAQVALVEHEQQPLAQAGEGLIQLRFGCPQVAVHHQQEQVGTAGLFPRPSSPLGTVHTGLQQPGGVDQPDRPPQSLQPQPIAGRGRRGPHGCPHLPHQFMEQGPDQAGLAGGAHTEHHHHQIAPFQFGRHALLLLAQGLPGHAVADPLQGLINGLQLLGGSLTAVPGGRRGGGSIRPQAATAAHGP